MMKRILVICTGNICRSPVASAMLQAELGEAFVVESAGVAAVVGRGATAEAASTASARGLDVSGHRARQLDAALARRFDLLLVMEEMHQAWISRHLPQLRGRAFLLGHWRDQEVPDPIGKPQAYYEHVAESMAQCSRDWTAQLV